MTGRNRVALFFASLVSLAVHIGLLYIVLDMPLGRGGGKLFAATIKPPPPALAISRDPKDLYLDDAQLQELLDPEQRAAQAAERVLESARELIEKVEPLDAAPPVQPAAPAKATDPTIAPQVPDAEQPAPGAPANVDTTRQLLALAQPAVTPPQFVAPIQGPTVKLPDSALDFGADFDPTKLETAIGGAGGTGTGTGTGTGRGTGRVAPRPVEPPPPPAPPIVAKAAPPKPPPPLPIPEKIPVPALPAEDTAAVHLDEDFDYQLFTYTDPPKRSLFGGNDAPEEGYFEARIQPRRSLRRLAPLKKDVVYAIDTSDSIGQWMDPIRKGVSLALDSLNEGDRFNIVMFKDQVSVLSAEGMLDATPANIDAARKYLSNAEASGYTDVNRALGRLLVRQVPPDRVYQIILLSDGAPTRGATDPHSIINLITRENDLVASIYCVGTGNTIKRELLQFIAYRNKGFVVYPESAFKVQETIADLAARLRYPIVRDAVFAAIGVDGETIYPRIPRDIYQSDPVSLFGRFPKDAEKLSMRLTGVNGPQRLDLTFTLDFAQAQPGAEQVMHNWAFWRLHHLYSETIREGETPAIKRQIDDLKRKYKIKTSY